MPFSTIFVRENTVANRANIRIHACRNWSKGRGKMLAAPCASLMTLKKWATLTELFVDQMIIRLTGSPNSDQIFIRRTLITHQARKLGWLLRLGLQQQVPSTLIRWSPDQTAWRASAPAGLESGGTREGQSEGTDSIRPPSRARRCTVQYTTILLLCIPAP